MYIDILARGTVWWPQYTQLVILEWQFVRLNQGGLQRGGRGGSRPHNWLCSTLLIYFPSIPGEVKYYDGDDENWARVCQ
jgi:hypothetical protein